MGTRAEQLLLLPGRADAVDHGAGLATQLVVVPRLQAGESDLVACPVAVRVLLEQFGRDVADRAEERCGELLGRGQRQVVVHEAGAPDRLHSVDQRLGRGPAPQGDGGHERLGSGGEDPRHVRLGVDVDERGQRSGRGLGVPGSHRAPVDAEGGDVAGYDDLGVVTTEHRTTPGQDRRDVEALALRQVGVHQAGLPAGRPAVGRLDEGRLRPVRPDAPATCQLQSRSVVTRPLASCVAATATSGSRSPMPARTAPKLSATSSGLVVVEGHAGHFADAERTSELLGLIGGRVVAAERLAAGGQAERDHKAEGQRHEDGVRGGSSRHAIDGNRSRSHRQRQLMRAIDSECL